MRFNLTLTLIGLLLLLASPSLAAQDISTQATYSFVYVYQPQQGVVDIGMIDPTVNPVSANVVSVSVEELWFLADAAKNVGNEWIALAFQVGSSQTMRLVNLSTTEIRDVAMGLLLPPPPDAIMGPQQELAWSPDGGYLAFNTFSNESAVEPRTDTLLYSLAENQTFRLTDDAALQTRLAWSSDSRQLAIATVTCADECTASIDLFDPASRNRTGSLSITPGAFGANSIGRAGICHLDWSPDGDYITFMANCDALEYGYYKEIYILETSQGSLTRITDFTYTQDLATQNGFIFGDYEPTWVDNETLLISAIHGLGENIRSETLEYNVNSGTLNKVSDQYVTEWAVNPISRALAFQSIGTDPAAYQNQRQSQPVELVPQETLSQATTATDVLPASITATAGCDLTWSPDGTVLAYSVSSGEVCGSDLQSFEFIIGERGAATQYTPSFDDGEPFNLMAVGWVAK